MADLKNDLSNGRTIGRAYYEDLSIIYNQIVGYVYDSSQNKMVGCRWNLEGENLSMCRDSSKYYDLNINRIAANEIKNKTK